MPNLDEAWGAWPSTLIGYGLGKELGATPVMVPGSSVMASSESGLARS